MATVTNKVVWADNTEDLKSKILSGTDSIVAMKNAVDKTVQSLGGGGLLAAANKVTAAIQEMGGAQKLTSAEQERVNDLVTKAIDKYQALGLQAPDAMKRLAAETQAAETPMTAIQEIAGKVGQALAAAFTVNAVKNAIGSFLEFTGSLTDMSQKTGISTTELQKLKLAAEQNGGTLDQVTGGIAKMAKSLVGGDQSAVAAMTRLGLSITDVRSMAPGEAFATIADKIAGVESPLERSKLAMDLFGKSGADLLPVMTGNLSETMKAAEQLGIVLDEKTVAAGDNLGDTLTALQGVGMAILGKLLAPMLPAFQMVATAMLSAGSVVDYLRDMFDALVRAGLIAEKWLIDSAVKVGELASKVPLLGKELSFNADAMNALRDQSTWLGGAIKGLEQSTDNATSTISKARIPVGLLTDDQKAAAKAAAEHQKKVQELVDEIAGAPPKVVLLIQAIDQMGGVSKLTAAQQQTLADKAGDLFKKGAVLTPQLVDLVVKFNELGMKVEAGAGAFASMGTKIESTIPTSMVLQGIMDGLTAKLKPLGEGLNDIGVKVDDGFDKAVKDAKALEKGLQEIEAAELAAMAAIAQAFASAGSTIGGSIGQMLGQLGGLVNGLKVAREQNDQWGGSAGIASALLSDESSATEKWAAAAQSGAAIASGAMNVWTSTLNAGSKAMGAFKGAMSGAEAGAAFGPWGAAIGGAAGALVGWIRNMNAGRNAVEDFAKSFGGFDALHDKLETLGTAGEALWVKLTQGVGKSNPEQAKAVIDEITKAFADQQTQITANNDALGGLLKQLQDAGGSIPADWQPYIDALSKSGQLTSDNAALMQQLMGTTTVSTAQMEAVAKKYNLSLDQMGPTFQKQKLNESFQELIDDMDLLARGGTDIGAILTKTGSDGKLAFTDVGQKIQDMVVQSQKLGVDLPENMKPWVQSLIDQGLLLDASGNKITDISKLSFGESLQTSVQKLVDAIKALIDKMGEVPAALDKIPSSKTVTVVFDGKKSGDWPDGSGDVSTAATGGLVGKARVIPFPMAIGGGVPDFKTIGTDSVPAMLTPGEIVLNAAQQGRIAGVITSGGGFSSRQLEQLHAELAGLRRDLRDQAEQAAADRAYTQRMLPKLVAAAAQRKVG